MGTRKELIAVVGERYRASGRAERGMILDELVGLTGYLSTVIQISPVSVIEKSPPPVGQSVVSSARTKPALSFSLSR